MRAFAVISSVVAVALVAGSLTAYAYYRNIWDGIKKVNVIGDLGKIPSDPHGLNILLIGSDSRSGRNGSIGGRDGIDGQRSDTVIVLHISPGGHRAVVLSIPRDSVVPILSCDAEDGTPGQQAQPGQVEQINSTFAYGGPGCLWKTIERTTRIPLDDFIELTFTGFIKIINDLGGVDVCLPEAVHDPVSGLNLSRGVHHIFGKQALAFWRTREDLGQGSDLQRIVRDQYLMAALVQGIERSGLLKSPTKMLSVIKDASTSMATDSGMTQSRMYDIAESLRHMTPQSVQFIEVPTVAYPENQNWVQWTPQDAGLFSAIAHNNHLAKALRKSRKSAAGKGKGKSGSTPSSGTKPQVEVLNGSGANGIAAQAATALTSRGFKIAGTGNAPNFAYTDSVVEYASAADRSTAESLAAQLSNVSVQQDASATPGTIDLILGSSFTTLKKAPAGGSNTSNLTKTYGGINGNVNICKDSGAFSGPDGN
jgi:LCP family protein required for cell wall assembly